MACSCASGYDLSVFSSVFRRSVERRIFVAYGKKSDASSTVGGGTDHVMSSCDIGGMKRLMVIVGFDDKEEEGG
jgi:hypothetical protein